MNINAFQQQSINKETSSSSLPSSPFTPEQLAAFQDPQFQEFFQHMMEKPELAENLIKLAEEMEKNGTDDNIDGKNGTSFEQQYHQQQQQNTGFTITPDPGFVLKTQIVKSNKRSAEFPFGLKCFINLCHSPHVPAPPLISDEEFRKALHSGDASIYRMPLSMANPRNDVDKSNKPCIVYDACVHTNPLEKAMEDLDYRVFLVEVVMQYIEEKISVELSRDYSFPKMKSKGQLVQHHIKRAKRPMIKELKPGDSDVVGMAVKKKHSQMNNKSTQIPKYRIINKNENDETKNGGFEIQVELPKLESVSDLIVDVEPNLLMVQVPGMYELKVVDLPFTIDVMKAEAEYHWVNRRLIVKGM